MEAGGKGKEDVDRVMEEKGADKGKGMKRKQSRL